jgi:type IV secretory pathway VirB10-like protein
MTFDPESGDIRTTTTTQVDNVTGEVQRTTVIQRGGMPGPLTISLIALAFVAVIAVVYMLVHSGNRAAQAQAQLDAQNAALASSVAAQPASPYPDPALQAQTTTAQTAAELAQEQAQAAQAAAAQASDEHAAAASDRTAAAADRAAAERAREDAATLPSSAPPPSSDGETPQG